MADTPLSLLPLAGPPNPQDLLYTVQSGVSKQTTVSSLLAANSVKAFGAKGDGVTDDTAAIQAAFNSVFELPNSLANTPVPTEGILFFPPGSYLISSPITVTGLVGGRILGAGRLATIIRQTGTGSCIVTDGCSYTRWDGLSFWGGSSSSSVCFDLDWLSTNGATNQSNTFADCLFQGSQGAGIGMRIGQNGQGSENLLLNCFIGNCSIAGVKVVNANALQNSMLGGDIQGCANYGIWVANGSMPNIQGVGFQNGLSNTFDINVDNAALGGYCVTGCRSESLNFAAFPHGAPSVIGVSHQASGTFVKSGNCPVALIDCQTNGVLDGFAGSAASSLFEVISCSFAPSVFCKNGVTGRFRNSYYGGTEGTGNYVYDSYFKGNGSNNGMAEGQFTPDVAEMCAHAFRCVYPSGTSLGFGIELVTEAFRRITLELDGSDNPRLGFGPGSGTRDTFLNRQGVNKFGVGSSGTAVDGTIEAASFQTSTATVAVAGGGSTAAFPANNVGGTGQPTTANQNSWLKATDSTGATIWIPVWK